MFDFQPMPQPLGGEVAGAIPRKAEGVRNRRAEQGIAERIEDQRQGALGDMKLFVPDGQLGDEAADRFENRVERVAITGDDHPRRKGAGAFLAERIEALVDDHARIGFPGAGALDRVGNAFVDRIRNRLGKLALQARRRTKMMEEVGMGAMDLRGDGLQCDRLWALVEQQLPRRREGGGTAFFGGQAGSSY